MRRFLLTIALLFATAAHADLIVRNSSGDNLRLMGGGCKNEVVLSLLREEWRDKFKAAVAVVHGEHIEACWIEPEGEEIIVVFFADGDRGMYPREAFKQTPEA